MNPIVALGRQARLVRLQLADEVPLRTCPHSVHLGDAFVNEVLAEVGQTCRQAGAHGFLCVRLGNCQYPDFFGVPAGPQGSLRDAFPNSVEAIGDLLLIHALAAFALAGEEGILPSFEGGTPSFPAGTPSFPGADQLAVLGCAGRTSGSSKERVMTSARLPESADIFSRALRTPCA